MTEQCYECELGEHENYDNDVELVYVFNPDDGHIKMKTHLCGEHRQALIDDGYNIRTV